MRYPPPARGSSTRGSALLWRTAPWNISVSRSMTSLICLASRPNLRQVVIGACVITALGFLTGCVVNLWLEWDVWDYSQLPGNVLGQVCPQYFILWLPVSLAGIILDDWLRFWLFGEERPHYFWKGE
ncbi:MAG: hypothetical protein HFG76_17585 [Hungatella sp.]|nr:hypothetical protein [Hungatella sp.]